MPHLPPVLHPPTSRWQRSRWQWAPQRCRILFGGPGSLNGYLLLFVLSHLFFFYFFSIFFRPTLVLPECPSCKRGPIRGPRFFYFLVYLFSSYFYRKQNIPVFLGHRFSIFVFSGNSVAMQQVLRALNKGSPSQELILKNSSTEFSAQALQSILRRYFSAIGGMQAAGSNSITKNASTCPNFVCQCDFLS